MAGTHRDRLAGEAEESSSPALGFVCSNASKRRVGPCGVVRIFPQSCYRSPQRWRPASRTPYSSHSGK